MIQQTIPLPLDLEPKALDRIKKKIAVTLRRYVQHYPLKHKVGGRDLWIDIDSVSNAIILRGITPNAAEIKGFGAPVNKRVKTRPHPVYFGTQDKNRLYYGWKTIKTRTKTGSAGVDVNTGIEYTHGRKIDPSLGYFGMPNGGRVQAFGLDASGALPAFYRVSVPEWLVIEQESEINQIISDSVQAVLDSIIAA